MHGAPGRAWTKGGQGPFFVNVIIQGGPGRTGVERVVPGAATRMRSTYAGKSKFLTGLLNQSTSMPMGRR
jgi:hypothetical protein